MMMVFDFIIVWIEFFMVEFILSIICSIKEFWIGEWYSCCLRVIVQKVVDYLKSLGIGDIVFFGLEVEFFVFEDVCFD